MIFAKFGQSLMRWDPRPIHRDDHSLGDRATFQPDMSWDLGDLSDHVRPLHRDSEHWQAVTFVHVRLPLPSRGFKVLAEANCSLLT